MKHNYKFLAIVLAMALVIGSAAGTIGFFANDVDTIIDENVPTVNDPIPNSPVDGIIDIDPDTKPVTVGQHYADVPADAWYAEAVNAMTEGGLLTGYTDGLFHPDDPVTFAQLAVVLCRVMGLETANPADVAEGTHWAQTAWDNVEYERPNLVKSYTEAHWTSYSQAPTIEYYGLNDNACRGKVLEALVKLASNMPIYNARRNEPQTMKKLFWYGPHSTEMEVPTLFQFEQISPKIWTQSDIPDFDAEWLTAWERADTTKYTKYNPSGNCDTLGTVTGLNGYCILLAYNIGITNGTDANGTCNAYGDVTRAQLCQFLWNMHITAKNSVEKTQIAENMQKIIVQGRVPSNERTLYGLRTTTYRPMTGFEYFTNLQYYKVFPTFFDANRNRYDCGEFHINKEERKIYCAQCDRKVTDEENRGYELEKQAAYNEHNQWLKEFEGTRQWEIATGKI